MEKTTLLDSITLNTSKRIWCIDMNSYFASVEQQDNPRLRGKPVIVSGEGKRTIVVAASREAKKFGISTGMKIHEAVKLCPYVIQVYGNGDKYASIQDHVLSILDEYFSCIEVASIDEVYVDSLGLGDWDRLEVVAKEIKKRFKEEIGAYITCSIGISINKLMAKLASNMRKPDGLTILPYEVLPTVLPSVPVEDICGIGHRLTQRLHALGIYHLGDFETFPVEILLKQFKEYETLFFLNTARGIGSTTVAVSRDLPKSFSHAITLPKDTSSIQYLQKVLYTLLEKAVFRMSKKEMKAKYIGVFLRLPELSYVFDHKNIGYYTDNAYELYLQARIVLEGLFEPLQPVRQIGVVLRDTVASADLPIPLFDDSKERKLQEVMERINIKHGNFTIAPMTIYHTKSLQRKIHGFYKQL
jgi:DNA polymerase-4